MSLSRRSLLVSGAAALLASCDKPSAGETQLFLNWIFSGSFAGEAVASRIAAPKQGVSLTLRQGGQGLDPLRLVTDGNFGAAACDEILRANEQGADFVIIGAINEQTPAAFAALRSSGITRPEEFVGKRVGVLPFGSTGLVYHSLLMKLAINRSSITEVVVSPDLRPFIAGRTHDVQPIFVYDETVSLDDQNIPYNLILPGDYGVKFAGPCYFTTRRTLREQRDLCKNVVVALKAGWASAVQDGANAIEQLRTFDQGLDAKRELRVLERGKNFFASAERAPLELSNTVFDETVAQLIALNVLKAAPSSDVVAFDLANANA